MNKYLKIGSKLTNYNGKKVLFMIFLSLFMIAIISIGTYALFSADVLTGNNNILSGQVKMSYTESNEIGMDNALPIKDSEGKVLTNYFDFQVLSYIKTRANDDTQRKVNYNIVLEPLTVDNPLSDSEIKVYLTKVESGTETVVVEPTTIEKLNNKVLSSKEEIFSNNKAEVVTSYRLRAWIDESVDTTKLNEKKYSYKFRVNINNEAAPEKQEIVPILNIPLGTDGLEKVTHEVDDTLQVDNEFATEYRYRGSNSVVKNYVTFNNEVWRIIGVIPTEDIDGNVKNRIKIIKEESIGNMNFNDCISTPNEDGQQSEKCDDNGKYLNDWTGSTLNTYLNNDYYNTLSVDAKNMIGNTKYYLGGYKNSLSLSITWQMERKKANDDSGVYYYKTNPIMQNDTSKKIAIMYASDYGYAASKECVDYVDPRGGLIYFNYCTSDNWLYKGKLELLLTQGTDIYNSSFFISANGFSGTRSDFTKSTKNPINRPVLSLSSNVKISSGTGTSSDPYQLSL